MSDELAEWTVGKYLNLIGQSITDEAVAPAAMTVPIKKRILDATVLRFFCTFDDTFTDEELPHSVVLGATPVEIPRDEIVKNGRSRPDNPGW